MRDTDCSALGPLRNPLLLSDKRKLAGQEVSSVLGLLRSDEACQRMLNYHL